MRHLGSPGRERDVLAIGAVVVLDSTARGDVALYVAVYPTVFLCIFVIVFLVVGSVDVLGTST